MASVLFDSGGLGQAEALGGLRGRGEVARLRSIAHARAPRLASPLVARSPRRARLGRLEVGRGGPGGGYRGVCGSVEQVLAFLRIARGAESKPADGRRLARHARSLRTQAHRARTPALLSTPAAIGHYIHTRQAENATYCSANTVNQNRKAPVRGSISLRVNSPGCLLRRPRTRNSLSPGSRFRLLSIVQKTRMAPQVVPPSPSFDWKNVSPRRLLLRRLHSLRRPSPARSKELPNLRRRNRRLWTRDYVRSVHTRLDGLLPKLGGFGERRTARRRRFPAGTETGPNNL